MHGCAPTGRCCGCPASSSFGRKHTYTHTHITVYVYVIFFCNSAISSRVSGWCRAGGAGLFYAATEQFHFACAHAQERGAAVFGPGPSNRFTIIASRARTRGPQICCCPCACGGCGGFRERCLDNKTLARARCIYVFPVVSESPCVCVCAAVWANTCNIIAPGSPDRTDRGVCITVMEKPCALTEVRSALVRDDGAHTVWGARAREHLQFGCTHLFHLANVVRAFWAGLGRLWRQRGARRWPIDLAGPIARWTVRRRGSDIGKAHRAGALVRRA